MKLPQVIAGLLMAQEKYDANAFSECFSDDAVVFDEGKTYHGKKEIRQWNEMTNVKYKTKYEPLEISIAGDTITLTAEVSGTFDGSPAIIKYHFETRQGKITYLNIR
ncbi:MULTISPECIES: nuclear transport factor 2 family protein [Niastella]|uniref:Nuclear transport factor 2 family protein n=1 Tax=Niastella soli TaxID=2821487 RepID=A0ABS3YXH5_9BACT|nr:nuclear transport factor 2 family protein [Niastella soli]MBO9202620.1 nuclear transport factor 2 family protein [Niastella soli]